MDCRQCGSWRADRWHQASLNGFYSVAARVLGDCVPPWFSALDFDAFWNLLSFRSFARLDLSEDSVNFFSGHSFSSRELPQRVHQQKLNANQFGEYVRIQASLGPCPSCCVMHSRAQSHTVLPVDQACS